eukprot:73981-Amphidinium_carterae.2
MRDLVAYTFEPQEKMPGVVKHLVLPTLDIRHIPHEIPFGGGAAVSPLMNLLQRTYVRIKVAHATVPIRTNKSAMHALAQ